MSCKKCNRVVHAGGLCRRHWEESKGRGGVTRSYAPRRENAVHYHGLTVEKRTSEVIERAISETGLAARSVMGCILDAWAIGQVWRRPESVVLGGLVLALLLASSWLGANCAHPRTEPAGVQVEAEDDSFRGPTQDEALVAVDELEQRAGPVRTLPATPEDWQKRPPCDADLDEHLINGACYMRAGKMPPCGPKLLRYGDACFRAVAKAKEMPVSVEPDRPE